MPLLRLHIDETEIPPHATGAYARDTQSNCSSTLTNATVYHECCPAFASPIFRRSIVMVALLFHTVFLVFLLSIQIGSLVFVNVFDSVVVCYSCFFFLWSAYICPVHFLIFGERSYKQLHMCFSLSPLSINISQTTLIS